MIDERRFSARFAAIAAILAAIALAPAPRAAASAQSLGGIRLLEVSPRIITPNGDFLNDAVFFKFDESLAGLPLETAVLDVHGARVASLRVATDDTALMWDGKDDGGRALPAGIYIYSIRIGANRATGTVVIAR